MLLLTLTLLGQVPKCSEPGQHVIHTVRVTKVILIKKTGAHIETKDIETGIERDILFFGTDAFDEEFATVRGAYTQFGRKLPLNSIAKLDQYLTIDWHGKYIETIVVGGP